MNYRFNFPSESLRKEFHDAIVNKDSNAVTHIVAAQKSAIARDANGRKPKRRIATDPDMICLSSPDEDILSENMPGGRGLAPIDDQLEELALLATLRDKPLSSLPDSIAPDLRLLSYFLKDTLVAEYSPSWEFGKTKADVEEIYQGYHGFEEGFMKSGVSHRKKKITTGRDIAAFVHTDHPLTEVSKVIRELERLGVPKRIGPNQVDGDGLDRFASCGWLWIESVMGEIQRRCAWLSFAGNKWIKGEARPIQMIIDRGLDIWFSHTYPELHPSHPSENAMHFMIYKCFAEALKLLYSTWFMIGGNSVGYELDLWAANIGSGRKWPGVHIDKDHSPYDGQASALAKRIVDEALGVASQQARLWRFKSHVLPDLQIIFKA